MIYDYAVAHDLSDDERTVLHAAPVRGKRVLPPPPEERGGEGIPGAVRPGGPGGPEYPGGAQSAAGGAHCQKILQPDRGPGRPDFHRDHRADQGDLHLQGGQERPAGHLCQPVYRKRDPDVFPLPAQAPGGGLPVGHPGGLRRGRLPLPDGHYRGGRQHAGGVGRPGRLPGSPAVRQHLPDPPGTDDRHHALRPGRPRPPHPAGNRRPVRDQPLLCIAPPLM